MALQETMSLSTRHGDSSIVSPSALRYASGTLEPSPRLFLF